MFCKIKNQPLPDRRFWRFIAGVFSNILFYMIKICLSLRGYPGSTDILCPLKQGIDYYMHPQHDQKRMRFIFV
jgi:hypothetical protein